MTTVEKLIAALQRIINNTPCMEGGDCFYPRHDPDGEYIGEESVNPLDVISGAAQIAAEALAEARAALEEK